MFSIVASCVCQRPKRLLLQHMTQTTSCQQDELYFTTKYYVLVFNYLLHQEYLDYLFAVKSAILSEADVAELVWNLFERFQPEI